MLAAVPSDRVQSLLGWAFRPLSDALTPQARVTRILMLVAATLVMCVGDLYMTLTYAMSVGMISTSVNRRVAAQPKAFHSSSDSRK